MFDDDQRLCIAVDEFHSVPVFPRSSSLHPPDSACNTNLAMRNIKATGQLVVHLEHTVCLYLQSGDADILRLGKKGGGPLHALDDDLQLYPYVLSLRDHQQLGGFPKEYTGIHGLRDDCICTDMPALSPALFGVTADQNDRNALEIVMAPYQGTEFGAPHQGKGIIGDDEVCLFDAMKVEHFLGGMRDKERDAASCEERVATPKITHNGLGDNDLFHTKEALAPTGCLADKDTGNRPVDPGLLEP
jgi:hypothetical protein